MSIQRIPKLFFQTSKAPLKSYLVQMIKAQLTGEWTYMHFLDSDILDFFRKNPLEEFPMVSEKFKALKHGEHKADLFRYYFLFVKGGVFLDSDAMIYSPIEDIVKDYRFFSVNSAVVPGTVFQGILGSEPGNPLIYRALKSFYSMDLSVLESNYHILCKELFTFYQEIPEEQKAHYKLYNEKPAYIDDNIRRNKYLFTGDMVLNDEGVTIFKHYWLNKEGIPNTLKSRDLVYCCVFYNKDYFKLLDLLLKSMKMYSSLEFDFLVMTSPEFEPEVKKMARELDLELNLKIFCLDFKTIFQAACARLFIFDYPEISGYEKLLYLDTDIIIKGDLAPVFTLPIEDLLHGIQSGNIWSQSFGAQFFNFAEIDQSLPGINSGTLLFLNSENMKNLFGRIRNHVEIFTNEGKEIPYCMDQPFINYHAIKDSLYNNTLLNPLVSLFEGNDAVDNYATSVICHFSFPIGNFGHKFHRMREFLLKILSIQKHMYPSPDITGNKYSWGPRQGKGFLKFSIDETWNLLAETTWGKATLITLDYNRFSVEWHNHRHVLKFNDDFSSFISIRIQPNDLDFISGFLIPSNLNIYGDSHALLLFKGLQLEHRNLFQFGKTMFRVGRDQYIMNFKGVHNDPDRIFCLVYGEVDVRAHIGKQVHYGRHHLVVCKELVEAYMNAIRANITEYKAIIVVAVPPPVDPVDHKHVHYEPLPFIGTNSDRVIYTAELNKLLEAACKERGYYFFDPFAFYKKEDGTLNYTMSDGCIHIGKNEHVLKEFTSLYQTLA
uniref:Nucleotide-diphospho-sugar transferase domain-containing protein n=1 Tax=viral metagenome TaxID=1070528 RepID=A0A6C0AN90_9ZZZZ